jgi:hypothetical protein
MTRLASSEAMTRTASHRLSGVFRLVVSTAKKSTPVDDVMPVDTHCEVMRAEGKALFPDLSFQHRLLLHSCRIPTYYLLE